MLLIVLRHNLRSRAGTKVELFFIELRVARSFVGYEWKCPSRPCVAYRKTRNLTMNFILRKEWITGRWTIFLWIERIGADRSSLATQGTDKVTAKITYVLLVKIVTDEPIKSPNLYRWLSKKAPKTHWTWHFFISFFITIVVYLKIKSTFYWLHILKTTNI